MATLKETKENLKEIAFKIRDMKLTRKEVTDGYVPGLNRLRREYRHLHLAYCMVRGVPYELCEPTCSFENSPCKRTISKLMGEIEMPMMEEHDVENVCSCAE